MKLRLQTQGKTPSEEPSSNQETGMFRKRPFIVQADQVAEDAEEHKMPDLQTQLDRAARFRQKLSQVKVHGNRPLIQPKLAFGQPRADNQQALSVQTQVETTSVQRQNQPAQEEEEAPVQAKAESGQLQRQGEPEAPEEEAPVQMQPVGNFVAGHKNAPPAGIQLKVVVGQPGDAYEQEADRVADQVMNQAAPTANHQPIQRQGEEEAEQESVQRSPLAASITPLIQRLVDPEEEKQPLQRKENGKTQTGSNLESQLSSSKGGGSPLPGEVRSFMESRIGADFSSVRVHTDSSAVQMNKELNAQAFTHGRDVYFGTGRYNPGSSDGKRLLAHELTHVVQQTGAKKLQRKPASSRDSNKQETTSVQRGGGVALDQEKASIQATGESFWVQPKLGQKLGQKLATAKNWVSQNKDAAKNKFKQSQLGQKLATAKQRVSQTKIGKALGIGTDSLIREAGNWNGVKKKYLSDEPLMRKIIKYREQEVGRIIGQVKQELGAKFKPIAAGSTDLTSDYDVTFDAGENRLVEIQAVKKFNEIFRKKWGMESGTIFDTNVYTTGHMPAGVGNLKFDKLKKINDQLATAKDSKKGKLQDKKQKLEEKIKADANQLQTHDKDETKWQMTQGSEKRSLALLDQMSLVKIRRFMDESEWKKYTEDTLSAITDQAVAKQMERRLQKADDLYKETKMELEEKIIALKQAVEKVPDLEMHANNRLYERYLIVSGETWKKLEALKEEVKASPESTKKQKKELAELTLELQEMRSKALIFANEAYHTGGAAEHVVLNQQLKLGVTISPEQYLQSVNEQTGFAVEQIKHNEDVGKALWKSAKYVERLCDAVNHIKLENFSPPERMKAMLELAQELLKIKKAQGKYKDKKTDEAKSEAASQIGQEKGYTSKEALLEAVLKLNQEVNSEVRRILMQKTSTKSSKRTK